MKNPLFIARALASVLAASGIFVGAAAQAQDIVQFVSCPIYRDADSGKKSGCWLADDRESGARYDVSKSPTKPLSDHAVLVEGRVTDDSAACGSPTLDPVRVSVLEMPCTSTVLPAEGYPGRKFVLPKRNVRPLTEARPAPPKPFAATTFYLFFDFNRDFIVYQLDDYFLDRTIAYIRGVKASKIVVTGYAATDPIEISGRKMAENDQIARIRAEEITKALVLLGVDRGKIETYWHNGAKPVDVADSARLPDSSRRRVEVFVQP